MTAFLIAEDRTETRIRALAKLLGSLGYAVVFAADLEALRADRAFAAARRPLVLLTDGGSGRFAQSAVRLAREEQGRLFVVYVGDQLAPDLYKALVRSQAGEWIGWDTYAEELRELARTLKAAEPTDHSGKIVSFLPSKGGVGNTLLALETGVHLATRRRLPVRVALLDLNLQGGTMADALDVEPRFDVAEIVAQPERLDEQLIDVFTSRYAPRLDVFAGPVRRIALETVPPQIIFTFIDAIAKRYEAVLIDLPHAWSAWVDNILQGSDVVVLSGGATVPALRRLTQALTTLSTLQIPAHRLAVAVNPCDTDLIGRVVRRREIERPLSDRTVFCVRRDPAAAGALDVGRPLLETAPNARASRDIRRLAEWCGTAADLTRP